MSLIAALGLVFPANPEFDNLDVLYTEKNVPRLTTESIPEPVFFGSPEEAVYWELTTGLHSEKPIIQTELIAKWLELKESEREKEIEEWKPLFGKVN